MQGDSIMEDLMVKESLKSPKLKTKKLKSLDIKEYFVMASFTINMESMHAMITYIKAPSSTERKVDMEL